MVLSSSNKIRAAVSSTANRVSESRLAERNTVAGAAAVIPTSSQEAPREAPIFRSRRTVSQNHAPVQSSGTSFSHCAFADTRANVASSQGNRGGYLVCGIGTGRLSMV